MISRLKLFIKSLAITERAFALKCGIAQNTMSYYLSGQRKPSYEAIEKIILTFPNLSTEWLTRGDGEMLISQNGDMERQATRIEKLIGTIETLQESIELKNQTIAMLNERIRELEHTC